MPDSVIATLAVIIVCITVTGLVLTLRRIRHQRRPPG
jgi:hypothetical protein